MTEWSIVLASDLHFGKNELYLAAKKAIVRSILQNKETDNIQMVISAGDLTEYGTDGLSFCGLRKHTSDELGLLKKEWVEPLDAAGITTLLTIGNHDTYAGHPYIYKPVMRYVAQRHNATFHPLFRMYRSGYYAYEKNGVRFLSLGVKPTYWKWIKKHLTHEMPMILFYHFNTIDTEPYSDWWSEKNKKKFDAMIEPYKKNILFIVNGHRHTSMFNTEWNGVHMINGAGVHNPVKVTMEGTRVKTIETLS